jgi:precorrin-6Y C5,15-methyltransferase (decarboxylating)
VKQKAVTLIGIGADGCASLSSRAVNAVARAQVLVGGERHLEFFPQFSGRRIVLGKGLTKTLDEVAELAAEHTVCILASGDPLFFGVGGLVSKRIGADHVEVIPHPSSVQWAYARIGDSWERARIVSGHGRPLTGLVAKLRRAEKAALLTDDENTPARVGTHLLAYGDDAWETWVCENLGGADERVRKMTVQELAECTDASPLNVILFRRPAGWQSPSVFPFLGEDTFEKRMPKKGLITKKEVRALGIGALKLREDSVVWDIGAGSGSVAVEAALLASEGRVYAVEVDPEGVGICRENAKAHGADNVTVIAGRAPEALADLEAPDAIFVGGSKGSMDEIITVALDKAKPGARIVVTAITLDNVAEAYRAFRGRGIAPEVTMVNISRAEPLAHYMRWSALNPIHIFAATKPAAVEQAS